MTIVLIILCRFAAFMTIMWYAVASQIIMYYADAKTVKANQQLSHEYVNAFEKITSINKTDFAFFDNIGWRVREKTTKDNPAEQKD